MTAKVNRTRRVRRRENAALKHGKKAKPLHTSKSGRTGSVMSKKLKTLKAPK